MNAKHKTKTEPGLPTSQFCIADKGNLEGLFAILMMQGDMCPKCGSGTLKTSKNWRRCKRCGERLHLVPATKELVEGNLKAIEESLR